MIGIFQFCKNTYNVVFHCDRCNGKPVRDKDFTTTWILVT